jgi:hypothetical protein
MLSGKTQKTKEPLPGQFPNNRVEVRYYPGFAGCLCYPALFLIEVIILPYSAPRIPHKW